MNDAQHGSGPGDTHNEFSGYADIVVQARTIYGGLHFHGGSRRTPISTRATVAWLVTAGGLVAGGAYLVRGGLARTNGSADTRELILGIVCLAAALRIVPIVWRWWRSSHGRVDQAVERLISVAVPALAGAVRSQWEREERLRRLQDPVPLPVRWSPADALITDHWENIRGGSTGLDPVDLSGCLDEIAEVFARVPSGRLVVLGQAGSGKSVLALRFLLDYLDRRGASDPVPVILSLASWDPADPRGLLGWCAARLALEYPDLAVQTRSGRSLAEEMLYAKRVLLVLDGFDELPDRLQPVAIREINKALGRGDRLFITSRPQEYRRAVEQADRVLVGAAVVELQGLTVDDLAAYLPRTTRQRRSGAELTTKWAPVLDRLREGPEETAGEGSAAANLRAVLATPLMTALARLAYSDTEADPSELLSARSFPTRAGLENHLLDQLIPAVYPEPPARFGVRRGWRAAEAERWFTYLAKELDARGTPELAWWEWGGVIPIAVSMIGTVLAGAAAVALSGWLFTRPVYGLFGAHRPVWMFFGLACVVPLAESVITAVSVPRLPTRLTLRDGARPLFVRLALTLAVGLLAWRWLRADLGVISAIGVCVVIRAVAAVPVDVSAATGPSSLLRADRRATLTLGGVGHVLLGNLQRWRMAGVLLGPMALLLFWRADLGPVTVRPASLPTALVVSAAASFTYGVSSSAWGRFTLSRFVLASGRALPWRVMAFLDDAHRKGVLRQTGGVYQFRHARLQERLAGRTSGPVHSAPYAARRAATRVGSWPAEVIGVVSGLVVLLGVGGLAASATVYAPGSPYPYEAVPPACSLLDTATVSRLVPGARRSGGQYEFDRDLQICSWISADRKSAITVNVYLGRPRPIPGAHETYRPVDTAYQYMNARRDDLKGEHAVSGLCADAVIDEGAPGDPIKEVLLITRCANLVVETDYQTEAGSLPSVERTAERLAKQALVAAAGKDPTKKHG